MGKEHWILKAPQVHYTGFYGIAETALGITLWSDLTQVWFGFVTWLFSPFITNHVDILVKKSFRLHRESVCSFPRAALTKYQNWVASINRYLLSHSSGARSQIKVSAGPSSSEVSRGESVFASPSCWYNMCPIFGIPWLGDTSLQLDDHLLAMSSCHFPAVPVCFCVQIVSFEK